jgi:hypothetical protein
MKKAIIMLMILSFVAGCASISRVQKPSHCKFFPRSEYDAAWTRVYGALAKLGYSFKPRYDTTVGGIIPVLPMWISSTHYRYPFLNSNIIETPDGLIIVRELTRNQTLITVYYSQDSEEELATWILNYVAEVVIK